MGVTRSAEGQVGDERIEGTTKRVSKCVVIFGPISSPRRLKEQTGLELVTKARPPADVVERRRAVGMFDYRIRSRRPG